MSRKLTNGVANERREEMKIPEICIIHSDLDSLSAGWYVPNSIYVDDIIPVWREPGGGVTKTELVDTVESALDKGISYTKKRIDHCKQHLAKLKKARNKPTNKPKGGRYVR